MHKQDIDKVCKIEFQEFPQKIIRKTVGICNEVFEVKFRNKSYILRINKEKNYLYGTHKFFPLFQKLKIKTPRIIAENYSKNKFAFCYQFLSKIQGKDLGLVIHKLSEKNLKSIAIEISNIFDKFNQIPSKKDFGGISGLNEEKYNSLSEIILNHKQTILDRNEKTGVIDQLLLKILNEVIDTHQDYFLEVKAKLYYDDISSKNIMIHHGKFNGLVDLDFLMKGDYLEAIGRIMASWYGNKHGEIYINEIMKLQKLDDNQKKIVKVYAILNLIYWISEEGIKFNSNSSEVINWNKVRSKKRQVLGLFDEIKN